MTKPTLDVRFFKTDAGAEPVHNWLKELSAAEMKAQQLTKAQLAARMHTSRTALNRLLDENDPGLTLTTLASAAAALGRSVDIRLAPPHGQPKLSKPRRASLP